MPCSLSNHSERGSEHSGEDKDCTTSEHVNSNRLASLVAGLYHAPVRDGCHPVSDDLLAGLLDTGGPCAGRAIVFACHCLDSNVSIVEPWKERDCLLTTPLLFGYKTFQVGLISSPRIGMMTQNVSGLSPDTIPHLPASPRLAACPFSFFPSAVAMAE